MNLKNIKITTDVDRKSWIEFVSKHPSGSIFQTPAMFDLFESTKNFEPIIIAAKDNDNIKGIVLAVIQKELSGILGYFSSRTIVWGGPIVKCEDTDMQSEISSMIINDLVKRVQFKSIYIQFRNLFNQQEYLSVFQSSKFEFHEHLNYLVETKNEDIVRKNMSKSKIRQIKKTIKNGARIIEPENIDQVKKFYSLLKDFYKKNVKKPLPHWSFFKNFYKLSLENNIGKFFLIEFNSEIIGGIMCPIFNGKYIYEWYVYGQDRKYDGIYPSILATWAPIDYAVKNGFKYFDFMGAGKPEENYGVREFKSKFGGELVSFGRFERINSKLLYNLGKLGLKMLRKLK